MTTGRAEVATIDDGKPGSPVLVYGSLGVGVIAMGLVGWLLWPRPQPPAVVILPAPEPTASAPVAVPSPHVSPGATRSPAPAAPARPASVFEDREAELPPAEVHRLRGVAAWSGETLGLTVESRTAWRVTELRARVSRFAGDDLARDAGPLVLLPPAATSAARRRRPAGPRRARSQETGPQPARQGLVRSPGWPAPGGLPLGDRVGARLRAPHLNRAASSRAAEFDGSRASRRSSTRRPSSRRSAAR